jgi:hypothetical protein
MKLLSIEPTPSPNTMKLNVDESLPPGVRETYEADRKEKAPPLVRKLLDIPGVRSVFRTADFYAIERKGNADWPAILAAAREVFGAGPQLQGPDAEEEAPFGEITVLLQVYRGIPIQLRFLAGTEELLRRALPQRFADAVTEAASAGMIRERKLEELGVRYGELEEVAEEVIQEIDAAYPPERLAALVARAKEQGSEPTAPRPVREPEPPAEEIARLLEHPDWRRRYAALERMKPTADKLPLIVKALRDEKASIRRLAVVYLGDLKSPEVLPYLYEALRDEAVAVRRTAGDTLSDLGDSAAIGPMTEALKDPNKLVRWRAARFLYEVGDESALPALREAANDPEFEVSLQARIAIERIESGEEAAGTVWQQMTNRSRD